MFEVVLFKNYNWSDTVAEAELNKRNMLLLCIHVPFLNNFTETKPVSI